MFSVSCNFCTIFGLTPSSKGRKSMKKTRKLIIGFIIGVIIGMWFGINIGKDKPMFSNPFAEPALQAKLKQTGGEVLEKGGKALAKSGRVLQGTIVDKTNK